MVFFRDCCCGDYAKLLPGGDLNPPKKAVNLVGGAAKMGVMLSFTHGDIAWQGIGHQKNPVTLNSIVQESWGGHASLSGCGIRATIISDGYFK